MPPGRLDLGFVFDDPTLPVVPRTLATGIFAASLIALFHRVLTLLLLFAAQYPTGAFGAKLVLTGATAASTSALSLMNQHCPSYPEPLQLVSLPQARSHFFTGSSPCCCCSCCPLGSLLFSLDGSFASASFVLSFFQRVSDGSARSLVVEICTKARGRARLSVSAIFFPTSILFFWVFTLPAVFQEKFAIRVTFHLIESFESVRDPFGPPDILAWTVPTQKFASLRVESPASKGTPPLASVSLFCPFCSE